MNIKPPQLFTKSENITFGHRFMGGNILYSVRVPSDAMESNFILLYRWNGPDDAKDKQNTLINRRIAV